MKRLFLLCTALVSLSPAIAMAEVPQSKEQIQLSYAPVVKQVAPTVVNIYTKRVVTTRSRSPFFSPLFRDDFFFGVPKKRVESSLGSGVIIDKDGLVITNSHVVKGSEEITVVLSDGREFIAEVVVNDPKVDLAMLKIEPDTLGLPVAELKPSEGTEVGDLVLAIGNPFGVGQTVTSGIISATARSTESVNDYTFFIQTDAAINPGNSGGALVSMDGSIIGINTAIYSRDGGSLGIGFAIPSEMVQTMIDAHNKGLTSDAGVIRPWLGVSTQDVSHDIAQSLDMDKPHGTLVVRLHDASPLKKAGIEVGDLLVALNGKSIKDSREMRYRMSLIPIGEEAQIEYVSDKGQTKTAKFISIAPPEVPARDERTVDTNSVFKGVSFSNINPAVANELGVDYNLQGVVISKIEGGNGIFRQGDIVLEINSVQIKSPKDAVRVIEGNIGRAWNISLQRGGTKQTVVLR